MVWTEEADGDEDEQESSFSTDKEESQYNVGLSGIQVRALARHALCGCARHFEVSSPLTRAQLASLFPFHVIVNEQLEIQQWGPSMAKLATGIAVGKKFTSLFTLTAPANNGAWTVDDALVWCEVDLCVCGVCWVCVRVCGVSRV